MFLNKKSNTKQKIDQKRINVTFRINEKELELYNWLKDKGEVGGLSSYIKMVLYEKMIEEKK